MKLLPFIISLITLAIGTSSTLKSQINIQHPINRAVYQRTGTAAGQATIAVAGSYHTSPISSIQARLLQVGTQTPVPGFDWTIIDQNPSMGNFYGTLVNVPAGWYTLQVRSTKSGNPIEIANLDRFGIGDVFIISGQSNASGVNGTSGLVNTNDERVTISNEYLGCNATIPNFPSLKQLTAFDPVASTGENSWCYSRLGDQLVSKNNVPVAFFNAAAQGTSVNNWLESSNGQPTIHPFFNNQYCSGSSTAIGSPYNILRNTMKFYNSIFGARALLWHQGESDQFINTSSAVYQNTLTNFIAKTRLDFGSTIPWVVSRASYFNGNTSAAVIMGQNGAISTNIATYAGPFTDNLGNPFRFDNIHFSNLGLVELANRWNNALNANFFNTSTPVAHEVTPQLETQIIGNQVNLAAPTGYNSYKWTNGDNYNGSTLSTNRTFAATSGVYRCFLTDNHGNITFTQAVDVSNIKSSTENTASCSSFLYLSDLKPYSQVNGFGPVEYDKNNGGNGDGDGTTMTIAGNSYNKGMGVHANSELVYLLPSGQFYNFRADIGLDDVVGSNGDVIFQVLNDNTILYQSPVITGSSPVVSIDVDLTGVTKLRLKVLPLSQIFFDNANWANALLTCTPSDSTPPSAITGLQVSNELTKCISYSWIAATDNQGISQYNIFRNGSIIDTVPSTQLTYTLSSLQSGTSVSIGVQAQDFSGNTGPITLISSNTQVLSYTYPPYPDICLGRTYLPQVSPEGGVFQVLSSNFVTSYNLNTLTGDVIINSVSDPLNNGLFIRYTVGANTACEDNINYFIRGNAAPPTPTITTADTLINTNTSSLITSSSCAGFTTYWFDGTSTTNTTSQNFILTDTTRVFALCRNNSCFSDTSNSILIKVIPDCPPNWDLRSTADDFPGTSKALNFRANQAILAENDLTLEAEVNYKAGSTITLNPGFKADSGTVFSAKIEGCP